MSIEAVCASLAAIGETVTGIRYAFVKPPKALDTANLPALYPLVGRATDDDASVDYIVETRVYRVQVAILPFGQGTIEQIETLGRRLIPLVKAAFHARRSLENVPTVQAVRVVGDTGLVNLQSYDGKFIGFEVEVEVMEYDRRNFIDYPMP